MKMNLSRCVAFITGGAQGLGRAFSERLLKEGAKVAVADIKNEVGKNFENEMTKIYGENRLKFIQCDVSNQVDLYKSFEEVKSTFGSLDIVCNNAGIMSYDVADARKIMAVNLMAVIEGTYKGIEMMSIKNGGNGGLVINIASAAGLDIMKGESLYSTSKVGVVTFTRSFKYLPVKEEDGVRVNALCPFFCDTEMVKTAVKEFPKQFVDFYLGMGQAQIDDVVKAFMRCVEKETMNGDCTAIYPNNTIFDVHFPRVKPSSKL